MSKIALFRTKLFQVMFGLALVIGVGVAFAIDSDNDGMSDLYETFFQLNESDGSDATKNYDGDGLNNLEEFAAWTDPMAADTDADGFPDHQDDNPLSRTVIIWGYPDFTDGDTYRYTGPVWLTGAGKRGGEWIAEDSSWSVPPGSSASLYVDLDRTTLAEDVMLELGYLDVAGCTVTLSLLDSAGAILMEGISVAPDGDSGEYKLDRYPLPLASFPTASRILLRARTGSNTYVVYSTMLYIDADGDGLDADQEKQLGTSDTNTDSDGDGLSDYQEVIEFKSNPMNSDSDGDGLSDAEEVAAGTNPMSEDSDEDGLTDAEERAQRYYLSDKLMSWPEAKAFAEVRGGYLAVITSFDELSEVKAAWPCLPLTRPWLGATDVVEDGVWKWVTGEPFEYAPWADGEPNNYDGPQMYLRFARNPGWDDAGATDRAPGLIEYATGLDPNNADTDGDGLTDGREVKWYKSDAHCADTNGDGVPDGDADGDGLLDDEELTSRYTLIETLMTWPEAKEYAEDCGGHLAVLTSEAEVFAVLASCTNTRAVSPWLGATDELEEGDWRWVSGEAFDYARWAANEPNNHKGPQMYMRMTRDARWDDEGPDAMAGLLIEYETGLDPRNPDTDGDGLSDGDEVNLYSSNPRNTDSDRDGLPDAEEARRGLSLICSDTDGDLVLDAEEIALGLNAANADTDGDGLDDGSELAWRYKLIEEPMTWPEAKRYAASIGGYLATVTSQEEMDLIIRMVHGIGRIHPWLGAEEAGEGDWNWVTDEPFEYSHWGEGEPNNYKGPQMYLRLYNRAYWDDASRDTVAALLVEFDEGTNPLVPDSDGDGLIDGDEVYKYGSDPRLTESDGDGIPDAREVAAGLSPARRDTDGDGLDDNVEPRLGLDPLSADTDGDGLDDWVERAVTGTDPLEVDSDTNGVADLTVVLSVDGAGFYDSHEPWSITTWVLSNTDAVLSTVYGDPSVTYKITVENPGIHQLAVHGGVEEDGLYRKGSIEMDITIDGSEAIRPKRYLVDGDTRYAFFTPWLTTGTHTIKITMVNDYGSPEAFTLHSLELGVVDGVDSDGDGIADWMGTLLLADTDSDGDGLTDIDEITIHGTSPTTADSDHDGLDDGDEVSIHLTDPMMADTDGDGVNDGDEVNQAFTDPLFADFGASSVIATVAGGTYVGSTGTWGVDGESAYAMARNGSLAYDLIVPSNGNYVVEIACREHNAYKLDSEFDLALAIDGTTLGRQTARMEGSAPAALMFWLPSLEAGVHRLELEWDNIYSGTSLQVDSLTLLAFEGPDVDGNGIPDWLDTRVERLVEPIDAEPFSWTSPVCVEGDAVYVEEVGISADFQLIGATAEVSGVTRSLGVGWYSDVPLSPTNQTAITVEYGQGLDSEVIGVDWKPLNIMEPPVSNLVVRLYDALLLGAYKSDAFNGAHRTQRARHRQRVSKGAQRIIVDGPLGIATNLAVAGRSIPFVFKEPGEYMIHGAFSDSATVELDLESTTNAYGFVNGIIVDGSFSNAMRSTTELNVTVVDAAFASDPCVGDSPREWYCPNIPTNHVVVNCEDGLSIHQGVPKEEGILFELGLMGSEQKRIIARLGADGPIMDRAVVTPLAYDTGGFWRMVTTYPDGSGIGVVKLALSHVPDDLVVELRALLSGVVFLNGNISMTLTADDFNEEGVATYYVIRPAGRIAVCHSITILQGDELVIE